MKICLKFLLVCDKIVRIRIQGCQLITDPVDPEHRDTDFQKLSCSFLWQKSRECSCRLLLISPPFSRWFFLALTVIREAAIMTNFGKDAEGTVRWDTVRRIAAFQFLTLCPYYCPFCLALNYSRHSHRTNQCCGAVNPNYGSGSSSYTKVSRVILKNVSFLLLK